MPQLKKTELDRIYLPSTKNEPEDQKLFLDYKKDLTIADLLVYDQNVAELENAIRILSRVIVAWNITDENDQPVEINPNTIGLLPAQDLKVLTDLVEQMVPADLGIDLEEKKS